jgi:hypothetical protein
VIGEVVNADRVLQDSRVAVLASEVAGAREATGRLLSLVYLSHLGLCRKIHCRLRIGMYPCGLSGYSAESIRFGPAMVTPV